MDDDLDVVHALDSASLSFGQIHHCAKASAAVELAMLVPFWRMFCDVEHAFGDSGFFAQLGRRSPSLVPRVVLLASPSSAATLADNMSETYAFNSVLVKPVDGTTLRRVWLDDVVIQQRVSALEPAQVEPARLPRVLVVDDAPSSAAIPPSADPIELRHTSDPWEAAELVARERFDLVVCSPTMRTPKQELIYRVLWMIRPEIRSRFAFVTSTDPGGARGPVLVRPLTRATLAALVPREANGV